MGDNEEHRTLKLFQYRSVAHVYQVSSFALKTESWLRLNQIPYETVGTMQPGPKGKIPYVKVGDETIADSNVIISRLKEMYGKNCDSHLTSQQSATAHAITRMLEEHTSQIIFYWRYCLHTNEFVKVTRLRERLVVPDFGKCFSFPFIALWKIFLPREFGDKIKKRGLAAHSYDELMQFCNDDLRSLSVLLGDNKFFFGDRASTLDATVFGHLANFLFLPMDFPQTKFVQQECPNLLRFMDNFKATYWPDWQKKCDEPDQ